MLRVLPLLTFWLVSVCEAGCCDGSPRVLTFRQPKQLQRQRCEADTRSLHARLPRHLFLELNHGSIQNGEPMLQPGLVAVRIPQVTEPSFIWRTTARCKGIHYKLSRRSGSGYPHNIVPLGANHSRVTSSLHTCNQAGVQISAIEIANKLLIRIALSPNSSRPRGQLDQASRSFSPRRLVVEAADTAATVRKSKLAIGFILDLRMSRVASLR